MIILHFALRIVLVTGMLIVGLFAAIILAFANGCRITR